MRAGTRGPGTLEWGPVAAPGADPGVSLLTFSGAPVIYPPTGGCGGQPRRPGSGTGVVAGLHARGHQLRFGRRRADCTGRRADRWAAALFATFGWHAVPGRVRDLLTRWRCSCWPWRRRPGSRGRRTVRFLDEEDGPAGRGIVAAANATKYVTPVFYRVFVLVSLAVWRRRAHHAWLAALVSVFCSWLALTGLAIVAGRTTGEASRPAPWPARRHAPVMAGSAKCLDIWTSRLFLAGARRGTGRPGRGTREAWPRSGLSPRAAPAWQARLHTTVGLESTRFGAAVRRDRAGYAMARLSWLIRAMAGPRSWRCRLPRPRCSARWARQPGCDGGVAERGHVVRLLGSVAGLDLGTTGERTMTSKFIAP